jgi:hypothetical protein
MRRWLLATKLPAIQRDGLFMTSWGHYAGSMCVPASRSCAVARESVIYTT